MLKHQENNAINKYLTRDNEEVQELPNNMVDLMKAEGVIKY